jgi:hypothetical protein
LQTRYYFSREGDRKPVKTSFKSIAERGLGTKREKKQRCCSRGFTRPKKRCGIQSRARFWLLYFLGSCADALDGDGMVGKRDDGFAATGGLSLSR